MSRCVRDTPARLVIRWAHNSIVANVCNFAQFLARFNFLFRRFLRNRFGFSYLIRLSLIPKHLFKFYAAVFLLFLCCFTAVLRLLFVCYSLGSSP